MRAPLLSVLGVINIARLEFPKNALSYFDLIQTSMLKLDRFVRDLGEYAYNERNEMSCDVIDIREIVRESIQMTNFLKHFSQIKWHTDVPDYPIVSDERRIRTIIHNILSNAVKFADVSKPQPLVSIVIKAYQGTLSIIFMDNGTGIHPYHIKNIFDMFFRGSNLADGSGLGLYIVKKVVDKMKGNIDVRSTLHEGTQVNIVLPIQNS